MLLNYAAPKIMPNVVTAPKSNIDVNAILGLTPSKYSGLQSVGNTGYFYGNNRMYETYTPPTSSGYNSGPYGLNLQSAQPGTGTIWGLMNNTGPSKQSYEEITVDGQKFRTVKPEVSGFNRRALSDDKYEKNSVYEYSPSMAYVYSKTQPQITAQPNVSAVTTPGYTPASGSLLTAPTMPSYTGNYGAGRFLNTGNLLGFNFTPSQTTASPGQSPAI